MGGSLGHLVWKHFLGFLIKFHNFFSIGDESDNGFKKRPGHLKLFQAKVRMKMIRLVVLGISKLIHVC